MHHPLRHKPLFESCKQQKQGNDKLKHSSTLDAATGLILLKYSFHLAMTLQKKITKIKIIFRYSLNDSHYKLLEFRIITLALKTLSIFPGQLPPCVGQDFWQWWQIRSSFSLYFLEILLFESSIWFLKLFFLSIFFSYSNGILNFFQ